MIRAPMVKGFGLSGVSGGEFKFFSEWVLELDYVMVVLYMCVVGVEMEESHDKRVLRLVLYVLFGE